MKMYLMLVIKNEDSNTTQNAEIPIHGKIKGKKINKTYINLNNLNLWG